MNTSTTPDTAPAPPRAQRLPEPLRSLCWASAMTALVVVLGYAAHRWAGAGAGTPLEPLPGSPWPYLTAWAVLGFWAFLLVRWVAHHLRWDAVYTAGPLFLGLRVGLAHRPDLTLLYGYGALTLAVAAGAVLLWRLRGRTEIEARKAAGHGSLAGRRDVPPPRDEPSSTGESP
ncbi:hypothetical protein [Streptomyces sp. AP-93]|uniref:hypothetical protein n=1 Tax=Streptomyces sp. AP-93 TaxID=2929048 RepID=UPI001FAEF806|nr:hypothetical protein [Streptomyces sp. AP-93]MCJ0868737.1 hypothetical protein [Streptomyces sp. AP-93]